MHIKEYTTYEALRTDANVEALREFVRAHEHGSFYQSPDFFAFIEQIEEYRPVLLTATDQQGQLVGSLLGVVQSNGGGIKSWLSRRLIVWGGPLIASDSSYPATEVVHALLQKLRKFASGCAIFIEFRNFFDTSDWRDQFEQLGFEYRDHLNFLVTTDEQPAVKKRMSSSRWRQIKSSLKAGAEIGEAENEQEIEDFYDILEQLYKEKVKKPLPKRELFIEFYRQRMGKYFIIRREGEVLGGIMCPVFENRVIYEWYVCGKDGLEKGLHPSVLATWAPIEYGIQNGFDYFDFMGAGKPDEDYGVREFKARFGGDQVCFGRYNLVVNKPLYEVGKLGLKVYQKMSDATAG